jgi:hypothetical protein
MIAIFTLNMTCKKEEAEKSSEKEILTFTVKDQIGEFIIS